MHGERGAAARREALLELGWEERLSAMGAPLRQLAPVLAVRRRLTARLLRCLTCITFEKMP